MNDRYKKDKKGFKEKYKSKKDLYKEVIDKADKITPGYKQRRKEWHLGKGFVTQEKMKWDPKNVRNLNPYYEDSDNGRTWGYTDIGGNVYRQIKDNNDGQINVKYKFKSKK